MRRFACLLTLAACAGADGDPETPDCTPAPLDLTWSDRIAGHEARTVDYTVPWSGEDRSLALELWYPTDEVEGEPARYLGSLPDAKSLSGAAFADPAPGCPLPVVVYSHGSQGWGGSAGTLIRHLVAQGWIAAAPDHTDNTLAWDTGPHPASFSLTRVEDMRRTIDALEDLPEDHPLAGRLDTAHTLVVGHSYGAQTAWLLAGPSYDTEAIAASCAANPCDAGSLEAFAAATSDPRVVATMPLDGSVGEDLVAAAGWEGVSPPIFAQSREGDGPAAMFERARGADETWVSVAGSCHESFTGTPVACPTLDKEEGLAIVGRYLSAFAARYVLGQEDEEVLGLLDGSVPVSERVTLLRSAD